MEPNTTEVIFTTQQLVTKEFYNNRIRLYADPAVQALVAGLNGGSLLCIFSVIYDEETPHTILWLVLYEGKYLPIETPYSDEIIVEFKRENYGFELEQCYAVELAELPSIIWRKFLGAIKCVPVYQVTVLGEGEGEFDAIEVARTLIFVASGHCYPITYTVECKNDGLNDTLVVTNYEDGVICRFEGKAIVTKFGGRTRFDVVGIDYTVRPEKGERLVGVSDLNTRQIRVNVDGGKVSYIIPSCSDGKFRSSGRPCFMWRECDGKREEVFGKIVVVFVLFEYSDKYKKMIKIVGENVSVNILDGEYEITDFIHNERLSELFTPRG